MSERADSRGPGPELGPVPGDGTGGDIAPSPGAAARPSRLPPLAG